MSSLCLCTQSAMNGPVKQNAENTLPACQYKLAITTVTVKTVSRTQWSEQVVPLSDSPGHKNKHFFHTSTLKEAKIGQISCKTQQRCLLFWSIPFQYSNCGQFHTVKIVRSICRRALEWEDKKGFLWTDLLLDKVRAEYNAQLIDTQSFDLRDEAEAARKVACDLGFLPPLSLADLEIALPRTANNLGGASFMFKGSWYSSIFKLLCCVHRAAISSFYSHPVREDCSCCCRTWPRIWQTEYDWTGDVQSIWGGTVTWRWRLADQTLQTQTKGGLKWVLWIKLCRSGKLIPTRLKVKVSMTRAR